MERDHPEVKASQEGGMSAPKSHANSESWHYVSARSGAAPKGLVNSGRGLVRALGCKPTL